MERAFYVDFVVKFKDGTIGLFDTKGGMTAKDAGTRAKGLQQYIKNNKSKKIWGGIVIESHGSWRLNDKEARRAIASDKEIVAITVDPDLETADVDMTNNSYPKKQASKFNKFKNKIKG